MGKGEMVCGSTTGGESGGRGAGGGSPRIRPQEAAAPPTMRLYSYALVNEPEEDASVEDESEDSNGDTAEKDDEDIAEDDEGGGEEDSGNDENGGEDEGDEGSDGEGDEDSDSCEGDGLVGEEHFASADRESTISSEDLEIIRASFDLPAELELRVPRQHEMVYSPPPGFFPVFVRYLVCGMVVPPPRLGIRVCKSLGLAFAKFVHNDVLFFTAFVEEMTRIEQRLGLRLYHGLFKAGRTPHDTTFYVSPREGCRFMTAGISNNHNWKNRFFFVRDEG